MELTRPVSPIDPDGPVWPGCDEPLLSLSRLVRAVAWWCWYATITTGPVRLSFWRIVRYYRRPYAGRHHY